MTAFFIGLGAAVYTAFGFVFFSGLRAAGLSDHKMAKIRRRVLVRRRARRIALLKRNGREYHSPLAKN